jgi:FlaG/FlaF family flagellin (archaellin)
VAVILLIALLLTLTTVCVIVFIVNYSTLKKTYVPPVSATMTKRKKRDSSRRVLKKS